jgi:hypothetical protein
MFDLQKCVNSLASRASVKSQGKCAKYVRMAIESGGLSTSGRPDWAWKYINYLPSIGFNEVAQMSSSNASTYTPQPGDIAVYMKPTYNQSAPGHICMYSGRQWISDFKQNSVMVYASLGTTTIHFFRYNGVINTNITIPTTTTDYLSGSSNVYNSASSRTVQSGAPNTVYQLASSGERDDVLKTSDDRKSQFQSMLDNMKNNAPSRGRDIITSPEMYDASILKTSQSSKQERT